MSIPLAQRASRSLLCLFILQSLVTLTACPPSRINNDDSKKAIEKDLGIPDAGVPSTADEKAMFEKTWLEVGIIEQDVRSVLKDKCDQSVYDYLSCAVALNQMFQSFDKNIFFGPADYFSDSRYEVRRVIRPFGRFELAEVTLKKKAQPQSMRELYEEMKAEEKLYYNSIKASRKTNALPHSEIVDFALYASRAQLGDSYLPVLYRTLFNGYHGVRDHASYVEPMAFYKWTMSRRGSTSTTIGVGTFVGGAMLLQSVPKGSGAELAGLFQGDRILSMNGLKFSEHPIRDIVDSIKPDDKTVQAEVQRRDGRLEAVEIPFATVQKLMIDYQPVSHKGQEYRYVKISEFYSSNVCDQLNEKIRADINSPVAGYILDLRGNPGGEVNETGCVAGTFVGDDQVLFTSKNLETGEPKTVRTTNRLGAAGANRPHAVPIVVLTNGSSASGAEALAAAIRDYSRGILIGTRTFGKGSVNSGLYNVPKEGLMFWKTSAVFYGPSGKTHNRVGLLPDIQVSWRTGATAEEDFNVTSEYLDSNPTKPENPAVGSKDPEQVKKIEACLDKQWITEKEKQHFGTRDESDLPMYYALEALRCM